MVEMARFPEAGCQRPGFFDGLSNFALGLMCYSIVI